MSADIKKLPVFETVGQSISFALKNLGLMVRLSWLWAAIMVISTGVLVFILRDGDGTVDSVLFDFLGILAVIVFVLFYVAAIYAIAVGWHRALLLGERPRWFSLSFGLRELTYIGYAIVIAIAGVLPFAGGFLIFSTAPVGGGGTAGAATFMVLIGVFLVGIMFMFAVIGRLFLVLPGTAVGDRRISLSESISLTRGNTWRVAGGFLLISLLNIIPNILTPDFDPDAAIGPGMTFLILALTFSVLFSIVLAFVAISYMSYCYWFFVPPPDQGDLA